MNRRREIQKNPVFQRIYMIATAYAIKWDLTHSFRVIVSFSSTEKQKTLNQQRSNVRIDKSRNVYTVHYLYEV